MRIGSSTPGSATAPGASASDASAAPRGFDPARVAGRFSHPGVGGPTAAGPSVVGASAGTHASADALRARFADLDVRDPAQLDVATGRYVEIVLDRRFAGIPAETRAAMEGDVARVLRQDPAFRSRLRAALLR